jgi:carbonic anhydrase
VDWLFDSRVPANEITTAKPGEVFAVQKYRQYGAVHSDKEYLPS